MSRWKIEKSGTGIEKSGTGIEKSGTGIEKSGTGIEKSGTGIEKSGTGIRHNLIAFALVAISITSQVGASDGLNPAGTMQIVVERNTVAVSWIVDGSVFSGVSNLSGAYANLGLTEIGLANPIFEPLVAGGGTGKEVAGGGTGKDVAGGGTGKEVAGGGTGADVAGGGTGANVAGGGTGANVAGGGTGFDSYSDQASSILVAGGGTGADAIIITLPNGTAMQMEVSLGCNVANVSIMDGSFVEVVNFSNVPVFGASSFCSSNSPGYGSLRDVAFTGPIGDFR